jgi:aryl-alcohol dehydrogenase-like predicted oxidoreductase
VPIPGTTKLNRIQENLGAVNVMLSDIDLHEIDQGLAKLNLQGARLPENILKMTGL